MGNWELNRRDFLKISWIAIWAFCLDEFLGEKIGDFIGDNRDRDNTKNGMDSTVSKIQKPLQESFSPLKYSEFGDQTNFFLFLRIVSTLDTSISISKWTKLDFKNNVITIPPDIRYSDMLKLISIIEEKTNSPATKEAIAKIRINYLHFTKALIEKWRKTQEKDFYNNSALKYFTVYSLFWRMEDATAIQKDFDKLLKEPIQIDENIKKIICQLDWEEMSMALSVKNSQWRLNENDRKIILDTAKMDPKASFEILSQKIREFINKNPQIKNKESHFDLVQNILKTTYKTEEILLKKDERDGKFIMAKVLSKVDSLFNNKEQRENIVINYTQLQKNIDQNIQIEIKRSFEETLYLLMTRDISLYENRIDSIISSSLTNINKKNLKDSIYYSFLTTEFRQEEIKKINTGMSTKDIDWKIEKFPPTKKKRLQKLLSDVDIFFVHPLFLEIINGIKSKNYKNIQTILWNMQKDERKIALLCISNLIWGGINNLLNSTTAMNGNYDWNKSEIKNLKEKDGKLNCMTMSVLTNMVLEKIFASPWKWVVFYKHKSKFEAHIANAIEIGDEYIIIDSTFDEYYIKDKKDFDNLNTYDVDIFWNAYISVSYYNMRADYYHKYIDSEIYQWYVKYISRKRFDYLNDLINQNNVNTYWKIKNKKIKID